MVMWACFSTVPVPWGPTVVATNFVTFLDCLRINTVTQPVRNLWIQQQIVEPITSLI